MAQTVTLISATQVGNPIGTATVVPVVTRGLLTFSITGPLSNWAQATVLASSDGGQDLVPIETLNILPGGPNTVQKEVRFGAPFTIFDANLDNLTPGQGLTATVTLTV